MFASRAAGEDWFAYEQPARGGAAVAALGALRRLEADGPGRFAAVAAAWRELAGGAVAGDDPGPPGSGLVAVGGFAFAPDGGAAPHWAGFGAGALVVPEVALARRNGEVSLTVAALAAPDDVPEQLAERMAARVGALRDAELPLLDPAPAGRFKIASVAPPEHYVEAVARAVERIRAGALEKVVLAREVAVHAPDAARRRRGVRRPALGVRLLLRLLRRPRRERVRRRLARAARPPRGAARARRSRSPARSGAPPTRPSTTTSASSCSGRRRTARSRRSSPTGSGARCGRTRSGSPRRASRRSSRSPTSSTSRRRSAPSSPPGQRRSSSPGCCTRPRRSAASRSRSRSR